MLYLQCAGVENTPRHTKRNPGTSAEKQHQTPPRTRTFRRANFPRTHVAARTTEHRFIELEVEGLHLQNVRLVARLLAAV